MTELEIVLIVICHILLSIASYPAFKRAEKNKFIDHPMLASMLAPGVWMMLVIFALFEGLKIILKKTN